MDFIGLDVVMAMAGNLFGGLDGAGHFAPPVLLQRMVGAGWLGRKSADGGFYDYSDRKRPKPSPGLRELLRDF
jgi:3-hydroxybutyryl-CoA dehydrogenase